MTGTPLISDSERIAKPMDWYGALTVDNAEAVRDRIERTFGGQRYTYASTYVGPTGYAHQSVRTGQVAKEFTCTVTNHDDRPMAMISVPDSYGLWYLDTSVQTRLAANLMERDKLLLAGAYLTFTEHQLTAETRNFEGAVMHTTIACERGWSLVEAAKGVLKIYDDGTLDDDDGTLLAQEMRWLRDALESGE